jgi:hypothetical protein
VWPSQAGLERDLMPYTSSRSPGQPTTLYTSSHLLFR